MTNYDGPCMDPQCNDSTWDHECPVPPIPGGYMVTRNGITLPASPQNDEEVPDGQSR